MEKKWKTPGDVILLHMCTINEDLMYGSWDIRCNGQISFVILGLFLPFDPPNNPKNQNFEKWKDNWIYYHFKLVYHKWQSMCDSWDTESNRQTFLSFWGIFCSFTPFTTSKIKVLKKMKKIPEDNIILHLFTTNDNHMIYDLRYGVWQTEFFAILDYFLPF